MSGSDRKILILGAGGQLGVALTSRFLQSYQTISIPEEELDICDCAKLAAVIAGHRPWVLINAAAMTAVDACEQDEQKAFVVNATAAGEIARQAARAGARVVHVSSDYVFDGTARRPYREDDPTGPLSVYGRSKLEGDRLVMKFSPDALIVRSSWLFGKGPSNFVSRICELAAVKEEIPVVTDHRGSPTYTGDLAQAIEALLEKGAEGLFHVSNHGDCSWFEYAREIVRILKITTCTILSVPAAQYTRPATRPAYSVLDNQKYNGVTGKPMRSWQEALAEFLARETTKKEIKR